MGLRLLGHTDGVRDTGLSSEVRSDLRASDAEREHVAGFLRDSAAEGRLTADELDDRVHHAYRAVTQGELAGLIRDLPGPPAAVRAASPPTEVLDASSRAGFWTRFGAYFIDWILVGMITSIVAAIAGAAGHRWELEGLIYLAYATVLEGSDRGQTVGKMVLGIRVADARTRKAIGYPRAFGRQLVKVASFVPLMLGFLWMLWDSENQCWHDKAVSDVVVRAGPRNV